MSDYEPSTLTLQDLKDLVKRLEAVKPNPFILELPAGDFYWLFQDDEDFRKFVTQAGIRFIGGKEACGRMMERCKKIGIN